MLSSSSGGLYTAETRNPKPEIRRKQQTENSNGGTALSWFSMFSSFSDFGSEVSDLVRGALAA